MSNYDSPYTLSVAWEQVTSIMVKELREVYDEMDTALTEIENDTRSGPPIFDHDISIETEMIEAHMNAAALMLEYYGEPV